MLAATALVAATSVMAKVLGTGDAPLHPLQVSAGRFLFGFLALSPYLIVRWPGTADLPLPLHLGRVACGWGGATLLFAASARLPLGDANAISFLAPTVTMLLSAVFLSERVGRDRWLAATVCLAGALVLSAPGTSAFQPAALLALGSALLVGAELVFIKRLSGFEPPSRILLMSNGLGMALAVPMALTVWRSPTGRQWLVLALLGATMVTAQMLFIQANRRSDASFLAPIFYTASLFAAVYDFVLFDVSLTTSSVIGISLIIGGATILAVRSRPVEEGSQRPPEAGGPDGGGSVRRSTGPPAPAPGTDAP